MDTPAARATSLIVERFLPRWSWLDAIVLSKHSAAGPPFPATDSGAWGPVSLWTQRKIMAARPLELPTSETEIATTNVAPVVVTDDGTI